MMAIFPIHGSLKISFEVIMIVFLLGMVDLLGSVFLFLSIFRFLVPALLTPVSILLILKSLLSFSGKGFYAGFVDISSAILLLLAAASINLHYAIVAVIGILLFVKAFQSLATILVR